jgi:hypothetical protein
MHELDRDGPALTKLSSEDEQYVITKIAEMLVLEYEANQVVRGPTVEGGSLSPRKSGVASRRK